MHEGSICVFFVVFFYLFLLCDLQVKLCKCWLIPTGWYLPRRFLVNSLRKRIARLHQDDTFIKRDGVQILTPECVEQVRISVTQRATNIYGEECFQQFK